MIADLRRALRQLARTPAFTLIAVGALAIGIGGACAMFTLVDAVLLKALPYRDPGRLVAVYEGIPTAGLSSIPFGTPDYLAFARDNRLFASAGGFQNADYEVAFDSMAQRMVGVRATATLFTTLGIQPAQGRVFTEEEDRQGAQVALISYRVWQSVLAGAPVNGRTMLIDRRPYQVIGVLPEGLELPSRGPAYNSEPASVIVPMSYTPAERVQYGARFATSVIARLRPGVSLNAARSESSRIAAQLLEFYPPTIKGHGVALSVTFRPLKEDITGSSQTLLTILLSAVMLVLLIACADIANLMLTRAAGRRREFAVRSALGASRWDLARTVLAESLCIAAAGAVCGALLASAILQAIVRSSPLDLPRSATAHLDTTALLFTIAIAALAAAFFGVAPALAATGSAPGDAMKQAARGSAGRGQTRLLGSFVSLQFALALVLLVGAGLLLRSVQRLTATDPGFAPDHSIEVSLSLPSSTYARAADIRSFYQRLGDAARQLPGVKYAAESNATPLHMARQVTFSIDNAAAVPSGVAPTASAEYISGDYFPALGVKLVAGRLFTASDGPDSEAVAIVNRTLARHFFPNGALGRRIKFGIRGSAPWLTIVGVVADVKQGALSEDAVPGIYQPLAQTPEATVGDPLAGGVRARHLIVRTQGDPAAMAHALTAAVRSLDPGLAIGKVQTLTEMVHESSAAQRFDTVLLGWFAGIAVLLAALGSAGVLSYTTAQRTREIGIRVALGAERRAIFRMVVGRGVQLAGLGVAVGAVAAFAATRLMANLLYRVSPHDPWSFVTACAVLVLVAVAAAVIPARRALRVDPMSALRQE